MRITIEGLKEKLNNCYSKELCYPKIVDKWNEKNKSFGMCAITSLIVNDIFSGEICKMHIDGISHYFNIIDGRIVDLTADQFDSNIDYSEYEIVDRDNILNSESVKRYNTLKQRLAKR